MRLTGFIVALCMGLAALKAAATVIGLLLAAALLATAIQKPAQTFGFLAGCFLLSLVGTHPWPAAIIILSMALLISEARG